MERGWWKEGQRQGALFTEHCSPLCAHRQIQGHEDVSSETTSSASPRDERNRGGCTSRDDILRKGDGAEKRKEETRVEIRRLRVHPHSPPLGVQAISMRLLGGAERFPFRLNLPSYDSINVRVSHTTSSHYDFPSPKEVGGISAKLKNRARWGRQTQWSRARWK